MVSYSSNIAFILLSLFCMYSENDVAFSSSFLGVGSGSIQLGDVQCSGSERSLLDCLNNSTAQCSRFRDAGVKCPSMYHSLTLAISACYSFKI